MNSKKYLSKFISRERSPLKVDFNFSILSGIGGCLAIMCIALLTKSTSIPFIMAPFGATCVLAFGVPESPLSQPRNIIGGHILSSIMGLIVLMVLKNEWYSLSLGVGLAIFVMQITKTTHPPAGADPLIIITGGVKWNFLINPVLSGAIMLVIIALLFNNLSKKRKYPKFWI